MTTYATGLRVSEVVCLKPIHIESDRMMIRVDQSKGNKDRYTLLSERLLEKLRLCWKTYRAGRYLFSGKDRQKLMPIGTAQRINYTAKGKAGIKRATGIHTQHHCFATHLLEAGTDIRTI